MSNALDLYANIEDMLDIDEVTLILNEYYFETLKKLDFKTLLDVGCGAGGFLTDLNLRYPTVDSLGIDLSSVMIKKTQAKGLNAESIDLCKVDKKFDVITAIFDMVNYLDEKHLKRFLACVEEHLEEGGHFICDINTLYAFKVVAAGSFIKDMDERFLTIDSAYEDEESTYHMDFTLFEKKGDSFVKSQESITQYYHKVEKLNKLTKMKLVKKQPIAIYGYEMEKFYLVFKK
jgi:predicted TPR repeat methyltransferase